MKRLLLTTSKRFERRTDPRLARPNTKTRQQRRLPRFSCAVPTGKAGDQRNADSHSRDAVDVRPDRYHSTNRSFAARSVRLLLAKGTAVLTLPDTAFIRLPTVTIGSLSIRDWDSCFFRGRHFLVVSCGASIDCGERETRTRRWASAFGNACSDRRILLPLK